MQSVNTFETVDFDSCLAGQGRVLEASRQAFSYLSPFKSVSISIKLRHRQSGAGPAVDRRFALPDCDRQLKVMSALRRVV